MTRLSDLFDEQGQSPWLDNLTRPDLHDGTLAGLVARGVRGVTANPTIVANAMGASDAYDQQFEALIASGRTVEDAYWDLAITDVIDALLVLRPTFDASDGSDGFVSIEVAPECALDTEASITQARELHERIGEPNLLVKIPATTQGVPAIEAMIGEGRSINITLIFSLARYAEVLEAYLSGLERLAQRGGDLSMVRSVASFFVSRVDTEVDRRLEVLGTDEALGLRGRAAVAQAKLAYQLFRDAHSGERWEHLASRGARVQRPLWASTSTKNPSYPDTLYVDNLIGPDTVNTLPEKTLAAFEDHGTLARTIDTDTALADHDMRALTVAGIDMDDVGHTLENQGIAAFHASFAHVLDALRARAHALSVD
jgi:transaldolase